MSITVKFDIIGIIYIGLTIHDLPPNSLDSSVFNSQYSGDIVILFVLTIFDWEVKVNGKLVVAALIFAFIKKWLKVKHQSQFLNHFTIILLFKL